MFKYNWIKSLSLAVLTSLLLHSMSTTFVEVSGFQPLHRQRQHKSTKQQQQLLFMSTMTTPAGTTRIPINEKFEGLQRVYTNPDIFIIENFLDENSCQDIIDCAQSKTLDQSPVAYAGWTEDFKDLVELATKGPVTWLAIGIGWYQTKDVVNATQIDLIIHMIQNFFILLIVTVAGIAVFTKSRADGLQQLRTSTSTTLDDISNVQGGTATFVRKSAELFRPSSKTEQDDLSKQAALFEAPTVIRYEEGQVLAPHYDANRSAATEDANRGGQTLATLLVYLNDVSQGGLTKFGKLSTSNSNNKNYKQLEPLEEKLSIRPKRGDALLFFPADANGIFDERTEHEGCPAVDEKWIARIWYVLLASQWEFYLILTCSGYEMFSHTA